MVAVLIITQLWDFKINLELNKQPIFELIYIFFEKKLKILQKFLEEYLKKGFIRKF